MRLNITNVRPEDFGEYECVSKNDINTAAATFYVYGDYNTNHWPSTQFNKPIFRWGTTSDTYLLGRGRVWFVATKTRIVYGILSATQLSTAQLWGATTMQQRLRSSGHSSSTLDFQRRTNAGHYKSHLRYVHSISCVLLSLFSHIHPMFCSSSPYSYFNDANIHFAIMRIIS